MMDIVSLYSELSPLSDELQQQRLIKLKKEDLQHALQLEKMLKIDDISVSGTKFFSGQLLVDKKEPWQTFVGQEVMGFTIRNILSEDGGMGFVFHAEQRIYSPNKTQYEIHKSAIKILRIDKLDNEQQKEMFFGEASSLMSLDHPNICSIYGVSEVLGHACIVMDYIDGQRLDVWFADNEHDSKKMLPVFTQLLNAIGYLHKLQVYHGDIKPHNIIVNELGHLIVIDLGLVRKFQQNEENNRTVKAFSRNWSPPEQVAGQLHTAASDVYSLGALFYYLLTGETAEKAEASKVQDKELWAMINKALSVRPLSRYHDANEFLFAVQRYQKGFPLAEYSTGRYYHLQKLFVRNPFASLSCVLMLYSIVCSVLLLAR